MRPPWLALLLVSCGGVAPMAHDGLPAGTIVAFAGPRPPDGWLACDGAIVARDAYPALYAAIGDTWGAGDGRTTFGVPDLRGRSPVGAGVAGGRADVGHALGDVFGADEVTLTVDQLPPHTHEVFDPGHVHGVVSGGAYVASGGGSSAGVMTGGVGYALSAATPAKTGIQLGETGGGRPVSLQPPSAAVTWIVRY